MYRNFFKTAWRNIIVNKTNSFINIAGLSVGMAISMLIGLWIWNELSFNKSFSNYNSIAQVMQTETLNGQVSTDKGNVIPLAAELRTKYKEDFTHVVLSSWTMNSMVTAGEKKINTQGNYMEKDAPAILSLRMLAGSFKGFEEYSTVLLSNSVAKALYGNEDPIGKTISIDANRNQQVVGVYEDFPANSSFRDVAFIAPFRDLTTWVNGNENNWYNKSFQVFVQLAAHADMQQVSDKIRNVKLSHIDAQTAKIERPEMLLHPMSRWHLYSKFENGISAGGSIQYVWMFAIIGGFVLLLACINFMNLSTARSEKRAKEVGIRKTIGSMRSQLIRQFFSESVLMAVLAFVVAQIIVIVALPFFNDISGKQIILPSGNLYFWLAGIAFTLLTGLLAGIYPAIYLSSFRPIKVLKGSFKAGRSATTSRRVLVVVQFTVSIILIIGTVIVFRQIQFARSRPTGYSKQGLITILMKTMDYHNNFSVMRNELLQQGTILEMAESNTPVTENNHFNNGYTWEGMDASVSARFNTVSATAEYGRTVGFEFADGRDFSNQFATDSAAIIINEAAAAYMGFQKPVGKTIQQYGNTYHIIGVIRNMVMESPYEPVKPTIFNLQSEVGGIINIRLNPAKTTAESIASIQAASKKYAPQELFEYKFADEEFGNKFADEKRIGQLATCFAILAIFISCLGIFGMASFMAEQRTKEIGVRKVLGASVYSLWQLLSKEFIVLVFIALLIAMPSAYFFTKTWLQNYHYQAPVSWWIFLLAGLGTLLITLVTVSFQSLRAAIANPARSLKSE
ncbi:ABC transporter permease [Pseudobacter ginsenosidimutans]|uniref:ABC-type antimicrobial peptide transport system permease subunit n=1 Tax=Pseudobacter ginsenosidimutans TaxID=661488 RepID=A0A4Q7MDJ5_9BACT|nr:ABC transporter permease [Pseudobacter ginsenosidimutans]QEC45240.1 FtsX-like permease family protein [Pseudobacter ginsenosidimutans]RZS65507.1 ABC-type antimicrobial peptide transport system permease subunit [Pseudobacter ginsenosidimutans]